MLGAAARLQQKGSQRIVNSMTRLLLFGMEVNNVFEERLVLTLR